MELIFGPGWLLPTAAVVFAAGSSAVVAIMLRVHKKHEARYAAELERLEPHRQSGIHAA